MKKVIKKVLAGFLLVTLIAAGFTGCAASDGSTTGSSKAESSSKDTVNPTSSANSEKVVLRYGSTGWKTYEILLKAAGLDNFDGYKVEYSVFQGGNLCLEALAADQIDFTGSSEIPPIYASLSENKGNFKIILVNSSSPQNQELVALKSSVIKTVSDLKGKKVGYVKSTTAQYFLSQMLKEAHLTWDDIKPVGITTADGVTALIGGNIDAFASYGNSINAAKNNGAITIKSAVNILSGNFPVEISNKALADEAKTEAIADYLVRVQKAYIWAEKNIEEWAKLQAEPTGSTYKESLDLLQKTYKDRGYLNKFIRVDEKVIASEQRVGDSFYELGLLEKKIDASTLYDNTFYKKYEKALSKYN
ncbi:putative aliphatic sulfonates-binding protein precursor [Ruminiclostridium hungatei]|uniref:Putative aliphatic sulfonates-binding protein n=1 Tax=Ruminiclostridium hungatei TaxID=48256 RepID=A0A1V4SH56_RUMHU|nr:ABC transporter substrate-binding protein [Ruminiclostridium hungatei]OPX43073.1 putative aliphatic sulfonates-binding protein precursor [Ruminiclostridium hungatei]